MLFLLLLIHIIARFTGPIMEDFINKEDNYMIFIAIGIVFIIIGAISMNKESK